MLFSFDELDRVQNSHAHVAKRVGVSVHQFLLVFQSRTLKASQKLMNTVAQRRSTVHMQARCTYRRHDGKVLRRRF